MASLSNIVKFTTVEKAIELFKKNGGVLRMPKGVICLLSALAYHGLTTEIPHSVYIAYQQGWR